MSESFCALDDMLRVQRLELAMDGARPSYCYPAISFHLSVGVACCSRVIPVH
jgi:hypothetical protein